MGFEEEVDARGKSVAQGALFGISALVGFLCALFDLICAIQDVALQPARPFQLRRPSQLADRIGLELPEVVLRLRVHDSEGLRLRRSWRRCGGRPRCRDGW
jgi:hypothetical protein